MRKNKYKEVKDKMERFKIGIEKQKHVVSLLEEEKFINIQIDGKNVAYITEAGVFFTKENVLAEFGLVRKDGC